MLHFSTAFGFHSHFCIAFCGGVVHSACLLVAPEHRASFQIFYGAAHIAILPVLVVPTHGHFNMWLRSG
jgi:hypothetical protein